MLEQVISAIDKKNLEDPRKVEDAGKQKTFELLYSERMTHWLFEIEKQPSEELQIAARANHIGRWEIQRDTYPKDREGYLNWREDLIVHHQKTVMKMMQEQGYSSNAIERTLQIMSKKSIKKDAECQMYEDVICLVFLEHYLADFYVGKEVDEQKMILILRKTWFKMSKKGQELALKIPFNDSAKTLISKALN